MPFIDLGSDVLSHLFALTDVYTVLSLSRVNRLFNGISSTRHLWLLIVRDLSARRLIDTPPDDIDMLCKDALVDEESIQCLEVHTGRLAWAWSQPGIYISSATFDFRLGSSEAVVALTFAAADRVLLCEVNLATGQSRDLLDFTLPGILWFPKLLGDFFICHARPTPITPHWFILLLNFRTEEFVVLECATDQVSFSNPPRSYFLTFNVLIAGRLLCPVARTPRTRLPNIWTEPSHGGPHFSSPFDNEFRPLVAPLERIRFQ
ncbi:hypothetical protein B0H19DRAFT_373289 [Mycena capillaripes]|nr:hypothetical protein B0H19DRAFT_373289 [Mycena capillaripes]